jgi:hypothetical protein
MSKIVQVDIIKHHSSKKTLYFIDYLDADIYLCKNGFLSIVDQWTQEEVDNYVEDVEECQQNDRGDIAVITSYPNNKYVFVGGK